MTTFLLALLLTLPSTGTATPHDGTDLPAVSSDRSMMSDSLSGIASTEYAYEWVSDLQAWENRELSVELSFPSGTIATTVREQRRFGANELSGDAHYWMDLWGDSYGHLHGSVAPNALTLPRASAGAELYEVVSSWEFSGRFEWREYAATRVLRMGPQIGRYLEGWYLRLRTDLLRQEGTWIAMHVGAARYYLGSSDSFVEAQAGYGETVEVVAATGRGTLQQVDAYYAAARVRHFFTHHVGAALSAKYSNAAYRRTGLSVALMGRW